MSDTRDLETAEALLREVQAVFQRIAAEHQATTRIESMAAQMDDAIDAYLARPAAPAAPAQTGLREAAQELVDVNDAFGELVKRRENADFEDENAYERERLDLRRRERDAFRDLRAALADEQAKGEATDG